MNYLYLIILLWYVIGVIVSYLVLKHNNKIIRRNDLFMILTLGAFFWPVTIIYILVNNINWNKPIKWL